jgi:hypothetical protein
MSVTTGTPQIPESVSGARNFVAPALITGTTRTSSSMSLRATSTAL